ncbi:Caleosin [Mycena latifolia]|nr:Caleosin [Mycena latifolia]
MPDGAERARGQGRAHVEEDSASGDHDGIIWPSDTYHGARAIGFGILFSLFLAVGIHGPLSYFTLGTLLPDPLFRIHVPRIHRALHGSDSGSFTQTGDLDENRFNYVFNLYSSPPHTHLSFTEGVRMIRGNRSVWDFFGLVAADGHISKEDIHAVLDGSIFPKMAAKNAKKAQ